MNLTELNQLDYCLNVSCTERPGSPAVYILLYVFAAIVVLLTLGGNLLVIISVFHFKKLHTPTNMLVLSLAISDFLIGALVMPQLLIWTIESCWILSQRFCIIFSIISTFLTSISIYNVVLIAVDRYFALSNPFLYMNKVSVRKINVVIVINCCVLMVDSFALLYFNGNVSSWTKCPKTCLIVMNEVCSVIDLVLMFIFPFSVIIILYSGVFVIAKKHATAIRELSKQTRSQTHTESMKSERKAAKVLGILVSVFMACLLPYFIYSFVGKAQHVQKSMIIFYLNSTINPVIYAVFYPWFRRCIKIIITLQIFQTDSGLINVIS
ncbi:trace amine-associated receptor 13c-like [Trichomycterus rosablanca]|uniref:trace amine-associated receptor 13c-like n=1 Tax=Trichomycterus rosablanca TaxID=2290929 RepID=UPI002F34FD89